VGASKLLKASIEVHLAFPVEQDFNGPQTNAATDFSQVQGRRLPFNKKLREVFGSFFLPNGSSVMWTTNAK
jgi:hypothetical protein